MFQNTLRMIVVCRSQWPRGLRRESTAAHLLGLWVWIPQGTWMSVCVECCVLSSRSLCDGLITRPEKSYRLWCVVVCDLETWRMRRPWPALGRSATGRKRRLLCPITWSWMAIRNPVVSEKISPIFSLALDANLSTFGVSRSQVSLPLIGFALSHCRSFWLVLMFHLFW